MHHFFVLGVIREFNQNLCALFFLLLPFDLASHCGWPHVPSNDRCRLFHLSLAPLAARFDFVSRLPSEDGEQMKSWAKYLLFPSELCDLWLSSHGNLYGLPFWMTLSFSVHPYLWAINLCSIIALTQDWSIRCIRILLLMPFDYLLLSLIIESGGPGLLFGLLIANVYLYLVCACVRLTLAFVFD